MKERNPSLFFPLGAEQIGATFKVMRELRPHLTAAAYVDQVQLMMSQGYRLLAVEDDGEVTAVAGFRLLTSLAFGKFLYVDDLVTSEGHRSRGAGKLLLDRLKAEARAQGCAELHLDSGVQRHAAHRFYLRERMDITCYHFRVVL
jgi:GNAT superfamily N-acetyltransferase